MTKKSNVFYCDFVIKKSVWALGLGNFVKKQARDIPCLFLLLYKCFKCNNGHFIEGRLPFLCRCIFPSKDVVANCKNG